MSIRQDALAFRFNPNELRLFENNGIETLWQLDLPPARQRLRLRRASSTSIWCCITTGSSIQPGDEHPCGAADRGSAVARLLDELSFPDELFYLKNQGEAK